MKRPKKRGKRRYNGFLAFAFKYHPFCQYCNSQLWMENDCKRKERNHIASTDHIIPLSLGGTDDWTNLAIVCKECNEKKANRLVGEIPYGPTNWSIVLEIENRRKKKRKKKKEES